LEINPDELRQRFAELSDEGLLSIDRKDLIEFAQPYYDSEIAARGLHSRPVLPVEEHQDGEKLVPVATFLSLEEANLSRALLRSADIPADLENQLSSTWTGSGGLRLMVPASLLEQAEEILDSPISDEELLAQAEAAEPIELSPDDDQ